MDQANGGASYERKYLPSIAFKALTGLAEVMVTRASRAITAKDFETRVVRALAGQYGLADAKNLTVIFDNEPRTVQAEPSSAETRAA